MVDLVKTNSLMGDVDIKIGKNNIKLSDSLFRKAIYQNVSSFVSNKALRDGEFIFNVEYVFKIYSIF